MMAQVVAKDPVAYDRALQVFKSGQSVYGGAGSHVGVYSASLPVQSYNKLRRAVTRAVPVSSASLMQKYVETRKWERVRS